MSEHTVPSISDERPDQRNFGIPDQIRPDSQERHGNPVSGRTLTRVPSNGPPKRGRIAVGPSLTPPARQTKLAPPVRPFPARPLGGSGMQCPRCQHENEAGAKFCEECAAPLARACAKLRSATVANGEVLP